jgi:DNA polymerase-3 subunit alpha
MGRFHLEDMAGAVPVAVFANQLQQYGSLLEEEAVVLVKGQVRERGAEVELTAEEIQALADTNEKLAAVEVVVEAGISTRSLLELRDLLLEHPGTVPVKIRLVLPDSSLRIATGEGFRVKLDDQLEASIEGLLGQGTVKQR